MAVCYARWRSRCAFLWFAAITTVLVQDSVSPKAWGWRGGDSLNAASSSSYGACTSDQQVDWDSCRTSNGAELCLQHGVLPPCNRDTTRWPGARTDHTVAMDPLGRAWVFGGRGVSFGLSNAGYLNDLWVVDGNTGATWKTASAWTYMGGSAGTNEKACGVYGVVGTSSASVWPGARKDHTMVADENGVLWLFGGEGFSTEGSESGFLNDMWTYTVVYDHYDHEYWSWIGGDQRPRQLGVFGVADVASSANWPGGRSSHAMWHNTSSSIWIFGGNGYGTAGAGILNDLWEYTKARMWVWRGGQQDIDPHGMYSNSTDFVEVTAPHPILHISTTFEDGVR